MNTLNAEPAICWDCKGEIKDGICFCNRDVPQSKEVLNITKGEWDFNIMKDNNWIGSPQGDGFKIATVRKPDDAKAICNAINSTYGKGYNPAAMEKMYNALESALVAIRGAQQRMGKPDYGWATMKEIETALQNSKL